MMHFNLSVVTSSGTPPAMVLSRVYAVLLAVCVLLTTGCQPSDQRPGLWLSGEQAASAPTDWGFTDKEHEIYVQVKTPYFIPHSVTIWCAQTDGQLFIGARNPETKNWPGWVQKNPNIKLKIADTIYAVNAEVVNDAGELDKITTAYTAKYQLTSKPGETPPPMRYWRINPT